MTKGNLTRDEAIEQIGEAAITEVENTDCNYTGRVLPDGDSRVEFSSSVLCKDQDGNRVVLSAYYYQEQDDLDGLEELDSLHWIIEGYEIA